MSILDELQKPARKSAPKPELQVWDWGSDFTDEPEPIEWLVRDIIPAKIAGDIYGPPGAGKSTLAYHLAVSCAAGERSWFGRELQGGPVVIVGGESSGKAAMHRSAHRMMRSAGLDTSRPEDVRARLQGRLKTIRAGRLLAWDRRTEDWVLTDTGKAVLDHIHGVQPALVLLDTIASATGSGDLADYMQQYRLGECLGVISEQLGTTLITISHTSQMSQGAVKTLNDRLHYTARAGGNGAPAAWRWMMGVTRLREEEAGKILAAHGENGSTARRNLIAVGVGKCNEIPPPKWAWDAPGILEIDPAGLHLIDEGDAVTKILEAKVGDGPKRPKIRKTKPEDTYRIEDFTSDTKPGPRRLRIVDEADDLDLNEVFGGTL